VRWLAKALATAIPSPETHLHVAKVAGRLRFVERLLASVGSEEAEKEHVRPVGASATEVPYLPSNFAIGRLLSHRG
jgi:hypothetical protein